MNESHIVERASALPEHYADRLSESVLWSIRRMRGGGEYGEMAIELAASLAASHTPVTSAERDELLEILAALGMPTDPITTLNVRE